MSPLPHLLLTIIKLSTSSTSPREASDLISGAISTYTHVLPSLSFCRVTFMRSSTLIRNILSFTAHMSMSPLPPPDLPDCKRLYELCSKIIKGFIINPCPSVPDKSHPDDPWDVGDVSGHRRKVLSIDDDSDDDMNTQSTSSQRGSGFGDSDSDDYGRSSDPTNFTQNIQQRKKAKHQHQQNLSSPEHDPDSFAYPDSEGALIIVAILAILSPTSKSLNTVAASFAWPGKSYHNLRKRGHDVQLYCEPSPPEIIACVTLFTTPAAILSGYRRPPGDIVDDDDDDDGDDAFVASAKSKVRRD
jgi:hypothetical protein